MASTRAEGVAEVLWELKRADKISNFGIIAKRAGFSAGTNGRAMLTAMKSVRRDWPHLQWWRAVKDDGLMEKDCEQAQELAIAGYEIADADEEDCVFISGIEEHLMEWTTEGADIVPVDESVETEEEPESEDEDEDDSEEE